MCLVITETYLLAFVLVAIVLVPLRLQPSILQLLFRGFIAPYHLLAAHRTQSIPLSRLALGRVAQLVGNLFIDIYLM